MVLLSAAALHSAAGAQDPFAPGLRWTRAATNLDPWIPRSVTFGAADELVWCSATGTHAHVELDAAQAAGLVAALERDDQVAAALAVLSVAAGRNPGALFCVAQYAQPDALHRATVASRYVLAAPPAACAPTWLADSGRLVNGPARIACDELGLRVFVAVWDDAAHVVQLDALDGESGMLLARSVLPAAGLDELCVAGDGSRVALSAGLELYVCDAAASVIHHELLAASTHALALARDGSKLAVGGGPGSSVRVLQGGPGGFVPVRSVTAGAGELAARLELDASGDLLAIGWWNAVSGVDLRLEAYDVKHGLRLWDASRFGTPGGLQNLPEVVRVSGDGRRIALGCWGDGSSAPELALYERDGGQLVLSADLPGSVLALDLDAQGTRLAVGLKNTHANQFASTGQLRLYDTGEADLVVLATPHVGGTLELAARSAGASEVLFLFGRRSAAAIHLPGTQGDLWLQRAPMTVIPVAADGQGRADLSRAIPADAQLFGARWHVQAAFRVQGVLHFSRSVLDPLLF